MKTPSLRKISFPFFTCCIDDTFTLIDIALHKVDHNLQIINSIDNNNKSTYEIKNNGVLPLSDTFVPCTDERFSTSVYRKYFAVSPTPHACFCHSLSKKMVSSYTFINCDLNICSNPSSFYAEIQYLKGIFLDRR